jgi:hypothetical protein
MKSFKLWMEEVEEDRRLRSMLFKRLGFDPKSEDSVTIKIRDLDKSRLKDYLASMGFDSDKIIQLQTWVDQNPEANLHNLLSQMQGTIPDEEETDLPSVPAELPSEQQPQQMR